MKVEGRKGDQDRTCAKDLFRFVAGEQDWMLEWSSCVRGLPKEFPNSARLSYFKARAKEVADTGKTVHQPVAAGSLGGQTRHTVDGE